MASPKEPLQTCKNEEPCYKDGIAEHPVQWLQEDSNQKVENTQGSEINQANSYETPSKRGKTPCDSLCMRNAGKTARERAIAQTQFQLEAAKRDSNRPDYTYRYRNANPYGRTFKDLLPAEIASAATPTTASAATKTGAPVVATSIYSNCGPALLDRPKDEDTRYLQGVSVKETARLTLGSYRRYRDTDHERYRIIQTSEHSPRVGTQRKPRGGACQWAGLHCQAGGEQRAINNVDPGRSDDEPAVPTDPEDTMVKSDTLLVKEEPVSNSVDGEEPTSSVICFQDQDSSIREDQEPKQDLKCCNGTHSSSFKVKEPDLSTAIFEERDSSTVMKEGLNLSPRTSDQGNITYEMGVKSNCNYLPYLDGMQAVAGTKSSLDLRSTTHHSTTCVHLQSKDRIAPSGVGLLAQYTSDDTADDLPALNPRGRPLVETSEVDVDGDTNTGLDDDVDDFYSSDHHNLERSPGFDSVDGKEKDNGGSCDVVTDYCELIIKGTLSKIGRVSASALPGVVRVGARQSGVAGHERLTPNSPSVGQSSVLTHSVFEQSLFGKTETHQEQNCLKNITDILPQWADSGYASFDIWSDVSLDCCYPDCKHAHNLREERCSPDVDTMLRSNRTCDWLLNDLQVLGATDPSFVLHEADIRHSDEVCSCGNVDLSRSCGDETCSCGNVYRCRSCGDETCSCGNVDRCRSCGETCSCRNVHPCRSCGETCSCESSNIRSSVSSLYSSDEVSGCGDDHVNAVSYYKRQHSIYTPIDETVLLSDLILVDGQDESDEHFSEEELSMSFHSGMSPSRCLPSAMTQDWDVRYIFEVDKQTHDLKECDGGLGDLVSTVHFKHRSDTQADVDLRHPDIHRQSRRRQLNFLSGEQTQHDVTLSGSDVSCKLPGIAGRVPSPTSNSGPMTRLFTLSHSRQHRSSTNRPNANDPTLGTNRPIANDPTLGTNRPNANDPILGTNRPNANDPILGTNRPNANNPTLGTNDLTDMSVQSTLNFFLTLKSPLKSRKEAEEGDAST